jgi:hypothetical protein
MRGAPVELDKRLNGVIASTRERGEFGEDQLETIRITPPEDSIIAKALLLVGLGDEDAPVAIKDRGADLLLKGKWHATG